jgi:hypothetical protein
MCASTPTHHLEDQAPSDSRPEKASRADQARRPDRTDREAKEDRRWDGMELRTSQTYIQGRTLAGEQRHQSISAAPPLADRSIARQTDGWSRGSRRASRQASDSPMSYPRLSVCSPKSKPKPDSPSQQDTPGGNRTHDQSSSLSKSTPHRGSPLQSRTPTSRQSLSPRSPKADSSPMLPSLPPRLVSWETSSVRLFPCSNTQRR